MRKLFLILAGVLSLLLAGGSATAIYGIKYVDRNLTHIRTGRNAGPTGLGDVHPHLPCEKTSCNFLVLGSDSRTGLSKAEQQAAGTDATAVTGQRADTIIVVNVNSKLNRTVVMHIPRDLLVDIPQHGQAKINSAFGYGANTMVRTVQQLTGLTINHYVQVNFAGFERLVDALGGVRICVDGPKIDHLAGLKLTHAGCYDMDGKTALAFVRARHVQGDNIPDFSRIARQQQFMRAVIDKLLSAGSLINDFPALVKAVQKNIVVDDGLNFYDLQDLTRRLSGLGEGGVLFRVVPAVPETINGQDYVVATPLADRLFRALRKGESVETLGREQTGTALSPAAVTVRVYDAGGGESVQKVAEFLGQAGFTVLEVQLASSDLTKSAIYFRGTTDQERHVVAAYLPDWPVKRDSNVIDTSGAEVVVVVGADSPGIPR
jgi:LCP family protein required for cell wall assembly